MKKYRQLVESLPSKTVVFAFGRFNPPTTGHELLVKFVKRLAQRNRADHIIYASRTQDKKKNPIAVDRKLHYLNLMFPNTNFKGASDKERTFMEAAAALNKKYKHLIMVAGSDRVEEYKRLLEKYNGVDYNFDSIQVISAGERDPDADDATGMSGTKMRALASKGDFAEFKKGLPSAIRMIDARRLMNDIREGLGLEPINEQVKLTVDMLREKYFNKEIYNVGDIVESINGEKLEIIKRGTNNVLVKDEAGNIHNKWIHEVFQGTTDE
jgi:nicotinic acid mononucleotide adenylyltransferase